MFHSKRIHWLMDKPRERQRELGRDSQGGRREGLAKNSEISGKEHALRTLGLQEEYLGFARNRHTNSVGTE